MANRENLALSKELIKLESNLDLDFNVENCHFLGFKDRLDFKAFLERMEFFTIAKKLYPQGEHDSLDLFGESSLKMNFKEKNFYEASEDSDFSQVSLTFAEDLRTCYFSNQTDILYRINLEDIALYQDKFFSLFKGIRLILTDNAKNLYAFLKKEGLPYKNIDIFDLLVAAYFFDTSIQSVEAMVPYFSKGEASFYSKNAAEKNSQNNSLRCFYSLSFYQESYQNLEKKLKEEGFLDYYFQVELPFCEVLADMEGNGIKLDLETLEQFNKKIGKDLHTIVANIYEQAGTSFNINSPKQLADLFFNKLELPVIKKTKTGFSTSEEVLVKLAKIHPLPQQILKYREIMKLQSTYIEPFKRLVDSKHRIHTTYHFTKTTTGRLSSTKPNLQNIPMRTGLAASIREAFVAEKGYLLVSADYSQIDLVILAHLSKDFNMSQAFIHGKDIHSKTAALIFNKEEALVTSKERTLAKQINFGLIYGKEAFGLAQELGISLKEAKEFIRIYFEAFPTLKNYFDALIQEAREQKFVTTIFGRKRYIYELNNRNLNIQRSGERLVKNTPMQGSSADILKKAMVDLYQAFSGDRDIRMLLQIHDEILFEIKEERVLEFIPRIEEIMENTFKLDIPLKVNINYGKNLAELK